MKLIDTCKNTITLNTKNLEAFWVYGIYENNELVFMYYGQLRDIIAMRPFKINEKFIEGQSYTYALLQECSNKIEAENTLNTWIKLSELGGATPPYNNFNRAYNDNKFIQCLETGRFYRSAQDIVRIFNVSQSALSNHLRGVPGYRTVKGMRFRYTHNATPDVIELPGGLRMVRTDLGGYKTCQA